HYPACRSQGERQDSGDSHARGVLERDQSDREIGRRRKLKTRRRVVVVSPGGDRANVQRSEEIPRLAQQRINMTRVLKGVRNAREEAQRTRSEQRSASGRSVYLRMFRKVAASAWLEGGSISIAC